MLSACSSSEQDAIKKAERHVKSAEVYEKQGQYRAAMLEARNALQQAPDSGAAHQVLAKVYNSIGAYSLTLELLKNRQDAAEWQEAQLLAEAYFASKKYQSTTKFLSKFDGKTLSRSDQISRLKLVAEASLATGDEDKFSSVLSELSKIPEGASVTKYLQILSLASSNQLVQAEEKINELLSDSSEIEFYTLMLAGDVSLALNQLALAESRYTQGMSQLKSTDILTVQRAYVLRRLIDVLSRLGRSSEAFAYQKVLADASPGSIAAQQKFSEALDLFLTNNLDGAEAILIDLRNQYPNDRNSGVLLAMVAQKKGKNELAADLFHEYIDSETVTSDVVQAAALANFNSNQSDEAIELLESAVELQPSNASILAIYGLALVESRQDMQRGINALEKSLAINSDQSRLRLAIGSAYLKGGKVDRAIAQFEKAYSESPNDFLIQQSYFKLLQSLGRSEDLEREIAQIVKLAPESQSSQFFSGWLAQEKGDYEKAMSSYIKAGEGGDVSISFLSLMGRAITGEKMGEVDRALALWEAAITLKPTALSSYQQWLRLLGKMQRSSEAKQRLNELSLAKDIWQDDLVLAQLSLAQGHLEEARSDVERMGKSWPDNPSIKSFASKFYLIEGVKLADAGSFNLARSALLKSYQQYPNAKTFEAMIKLELSQKNFDEAKRLVANFGDEVPEGAERYFLVGLVAQAEGKLESALAEYRLAWAESPTDKVAVAMTAVLNALGDKVGVKNFLIAWSEALPNSHQPLLMQAMDAQAENNAALAIERYQSALGKNPDLALAYNNLAWLVESTNLEKALFYAEKAYRLVPESAAILDTYGWFLFKNGQAKAGAGFLQKAHRLVPENKEIEAHFVQVSAAVKP